MGVSCSPLISDIMSSDSVLDLILNAIISSNVFQTDDDKIWATVARLVPSSSPEEVVPFN